jgi:hypothetical protein
MSNWGGIRMLKIILDQLNCHDEGDGSGNAEPYIGLFSSKSTVKPLV